MGLLDSIIRIDNEVDTQTELISDIQAALVGKAGSGSGIVPTGTKEITKNGTYDVTSYASAEVNVPSEEPVLQEKSVTPTKSQQTVTPSSGYDGLSKVIVGKIPDTYVAPSGTKTITENGDGIDVTTYAAVNVRVPTGGTAPSMQSKTVTPTTSKQTVTPDSGYDGLSSVVVNAMPTATQATPSISVSSSGTITATSTQSAGYVASGTKTATKQLTTKGATTITPTSSVQTVVSAGTYVTGDIKVAAVPGGSGGGNGSKITVVNNTNERIAFGGYMLCPKSWADEGFGIASCEIDISEIAPLIETGMGYYMSFVYIDGGNPSNYSVTGSGVELTLEASGMSGGGLGVALYWVTRLTAGGTVTIN